MHQEVWLVTGTWMDDYFHSIGNFISSQLTNSYFSEKYGGVPRMKLYEITIGEIAVTIPCCNVWKNDKQCVFTVKPRESGVSSRFELEPSFVWDKGGTWSKMWPEKGRYSSYKEHDYWLFITHTQNPICEPLRRNQIWGLKLRKHGAFHATIVGEWWWNHVKTRGNGEFRTRL